MRNLLAAILVMLVSVNAYAIQFDTPAGNLDLYSSVRAYSMFQDVSDSDSYRDITEVKNALQSNSRFGVKWNKDNLFTHLEFGASDTSVTLRLFYAGYKLDGGKGTIIAGQFNSITDTQTIYNRVFDIDAGLAGVGATALVRRAGLSYQKDGFTVQLTSLTQDKSNFTDKISTAVYEDVRFKEVLPKIEVGYKFKELPLKVFGAYALFNADAVKKSNKSEKDFDASAYHTGFMFTPTVDKFSVKMSGFYAVNGGLYGMVKTGNGKGGTANQLPTLKSNGKIEDEKTIGCGVAVNYKINENLSAELGAGYQISKSDAWAEDDDNMAVYFNAPYKIVKGFTITPEIGYLDYMKRADGTNDAKVIQVGAQFRIDL